MATSVEPSTRRCAGCGGSSARPLYRGLVTCAGCGLVYYPGRITVDEAARLYDEDYFHGAEYFDYLADRACHETNFRRRVRQLAGWLPSGRRVFEIGCAYGLFLRHAAERWRVSGCDVAAGPCRFARDQLGLDVRHADFLDIPFTPGEVDAFCLWDTIEHLDAPDAYLDRVAEVLPGGGLLALTTGDVGSPLARVRGSRWRQIHPPTHLWYFSRATIARTLDRFGFDVVWSRRIGVWRSLGQIAYSVTSLRRGEPSRLHRAFMKTGMGRIQVYMNTFDLMMIVARRRGRAGRNGRSFPGREVLS